MKTMTAWISTARRFCLTGFLAVSAVALVPTGVAHAQARALPDFTDLVDQVGPSVVNIRTLEKVSARAQQGGAR